MTDVLTEAKNIIESEAKQAELKLAAYVAATSVTISKAEHDMFTFGAKLLAALKAEGLEDWQGFERAIAAMGA